MIFYKPPKIGSCQERTMRCYNMRMEAKKSNCSSHRSPPHFDTDSWSWLLMLLGHPVNSVLYESYKKNVWKSCMIIVCDWNHHFIYEMCMKVSYKFCSYTLHIWNDGSNHILWSYKIFIHFYYLFHATFILFIFTLFYSYWEQISLFSRLVP